METYDDIRPGDSFERWHQATCRNYSVTESRPVPDTSFRASVAVRPLGHLAISRISSRVRDAGQLAVTRGQAEIRRDSRDDFFVWIGRGGTTFFEQEGRNLSLGTGDLMLMDQARPFRLAFGATSATTMIIVPRPLLEAQVRNVGALVARRIDGHMPSARLATQMVRECSALGGLSLPAARRASLGDIVLGMLGNAFDLPLTDATADNDGRARRLDHVKTFMIRHLDDPDLDATAIARANHMSGRTLARLFSAEGTTPMRWLWHERLRRSSEALRQGRFERVTDAALAHGFKDLSHFSRAFKAFHGHTPQEALRARRR
ncbi:MAG: helix-turn-helix domain-containing protein [Pigmentiphaga sp.]